MIKCEATDTFTLLKFKELKNLTRIDKDNEKEGKIYKGDIFECNKDIAYYLLGNNDYKREFIRVLEIIPDKKAKRKERK